MSNVSLIDGHIDNAEHCVCCGAVIPEGRQVCIICGLKTNYKPSTADVAEARHSYWQCSNVRMSSRDITCRYCHRTETISNGEEDFEYCPHCGAKMDGKDGNNGNQNP